MKKTQFLCLSKFMLCKIFVIVTIVTGFDNEYVGISVKTLLFKNNEPRYGDHYKSVLNVII